MPPNYHKSISVQGVQVSPAPTLIFAHSMTVPGTSAGSTPTSKGDTGGVITKSLIRVPYPPSTTIPLRTALHVYITNTTVYTAVRRYIAAMARCAYSASYLIPSRQGRKQGRGATALPDFTFDSLLRRPIPPPYCSELILITGMVLIDIIWRYRVTGI